MYRSKKMEYYNETRAFVSVALPRPLFTEFTYGHVTPLAPGVRVRVSFAGSSLVGVVAAEAQPESDQTIKAITAALDDSPVIDDRLMPFLRYLSRYYQYPFGEVVHAALPNALARGGRNTRHLTPCYALEPSGREKLAGRLGRKQRKVLDDLADGERTLDVLREKFAISPAWMETLIARGWVRVREAFQPSLPPPVIAAFTPSADQQAVISQLHKRRGFSVDLLDGVTGSGKTEVYIRWLEWLTRDKRQALVLTPEIGLAETLYQRLQERLRVLCVRHHSGMSDAARLCAWQAIRAGDAQVMIGTRSALFTGFADLAGIIVDEAHDRGYKQQEGLRYQARDMAIVRARMDDVPILLGSATPSLESYARIADGHWRRLRLSERVVARAPPQITLDDIARDRQIGGLSVGLIKEIRRQLRENRQVMLFLNRRGYAPVLRCQDCGWDSQCLACDSYMTAHTESRRLICHHCGHNQPLPVRCPACGKSNLQMFGIGTQRLEQTVKFQFPEARVLRVDTDAFTTARQFREALDRVARHEVDIVLGTQWLSKGHHFPDLHLVAVIDADQAFYSSDFRAEERLAQLLVQVGGRAGRESSGHIWIQTSAPNHPVFQVLRAPYSETAKRLLQLRRLGELPPYSAQAVLHASHREEQRAIQALRLTRDGATSAAVGVAWRWLGPAPALIARKEGKQRAQLIVQASHRAALQRELPALNRWLLAQGKALGVRVGIDVDPQWME